MGKHAALTNNPMPQPLAADGTRRAPHRRYHYVVVSVEADPEVVAEQCNRKAGEGYTLVGQVAVPRTGRTEVVLTFARRLRRAQRRAEPVAEIPAAPPENPTGDLTPREEEAP